MKQNINENGFTIGATLALIVVIVALALGGWYVWGKNSKQSDSNVNNSSQTPPVSQDKEKESKSLAPEGWKFYKSDQHGFSFYYPPEWGEVEKGETRLVFSKMSRLTFSGNSRNKAHDPVEFGDISNNVIGVSIRNETAIATILTGIEPSTREKTFSGEELIKKFKEGHACVLHEYKPEDFGAEPDPNHFVYNGYCGLTDKTYGAFALRSNGWDTRETKTQQVRGDIIKLLQTFETF